METFDYKPNSHRAKAEQAEKQQKMEKVVAGKVKVQKKTGAAKIGDQIKDGFNEAKTYLVKDVLIPSAKKLFVDIVKNGADIIAYGSPQPNNKRSVMDKVSFTKYWDRRDPRDAEPRARSRFDYDSIAFESKGEAELVLTRLEEAIEYYGQVSVAAIYELAGVTCDYTYNNYGWEDLHTARVVPTPDGYVLDLPKAMPLRR